MRQAPVILFSMLFPLAAWGGSGPKIVINEVLMDAIGPNDDGKTFVSIRSVPGTDLSNFTIRHFDHTQCPPLLLAVTTLPPGSIVPSSKVFVVGDADGSGTSYVDPPPTLAAATLNLTPGPGKSVVLLDAGGNIVDVVGIGLQSSFVSCLGFEALRYETAPEPVPPVGCSVKRICDGQGCEFSALPPTHPEAAPSGLADSGNNDVDFHRNCSPLSGTHPEMLVARNITTNGPVTTTPSCSAGSGATIGFEIDTPCEAGKDYVIFGSASAPTGNSPTGVPIDFLTLALIPYINTPFMFGFAGNLGTAGSATQISFLVPPSAGLPTPFNLYFAAIRPVKFPDTNPTNVVTLTLQQ